MTTNGPKTVKCWHSSQYDGVKLENSNTETNLRETRRANEEMGVYDDTWLGEWRNHACTHHCQGIAQGTMGSAQHLGMLQFLWRFAQPVLADKDAAQSDLGHSLAKLQVPYDST